MGLETVSFVNDLVAANPVGTDGLSEGDNHIRNIKTALLATFPGMAGRGFRVQSKSGNYTVILTDNTSLINCTATLTLTLTAVSTLGNGFIFHVKNSTQGLVTINPNASELIEGYLDYVVLPDRLVAVYSDGTQFFVLDTPEQHPNPIINSSMQYWGEGTATLTVAVATSVHLATGTRLEIVSNGTGQIQAFRDKTVPNVLSSNMFPLFSTALVVKTAVTTATLGSFFKINIEGNNFRQIAQRPCTFSFWIRSSLTGTYNISIQNAGLDRSYVKSFSISAVNTYEFKRFLIPASPSTGTWDYSGGTGIVCKIALAWAGATATNDAWTAANFVASTTNANFAGTLSASMNICAPLLSLGYSKRIWVPDIPAVNFLNCRRLFQKSFPPDTLPVGAFGLTGIYSGLGNLNGNFDIFVSHQGMRVTPTGTIYNPVVLATGTVFTSNRSSWTSIISSLPDGSTISPLVNVGSASGYIVQAHATFDSRL